MAKLCNTVAIHGSYTHDYSLALGLVTSTVGLTGPAMAKPAGKVRGWFS